MEPQQAFQLSPEEQARLHAYWGIGGQRPSEHPNGLSDRDFDELFTMDKPIVFAYHGYPTLIHRLTYLRTNHDNLHVRGYKAEGTASHRLIWWP